MVINTKERKKNNKDNDNTTVSVTEKVEDKQYPSMEDHDLNYLKQLLLEAQKNAESAKATVTEVMTSIYRENSTSKKNTETFNDVSNEVIEGAIKKFNGTENVKTSFENNDDNDSPITPRKTDNGKTGVIHRILSNDNSPLNAISEITRSVFLNKSIAPDTRQDFYSLATKQNKQLRQFIDSAIEELSRKKTEKIVEKAKSEMATAQIVVSQAQSEIDEFRQQALTAREEARRANGAAEEAINMAWKQIEDAREEMDKARTDAEEAIRIAQESAKRAQEEARIEKEAAEVLVNQFKQETMKCMAEEINAAREEIRVAREAAEEAIIRSAKELEKSRAEVKIAQNNAQAITALAWEKVRKAEEEIEEIKKQTQLSISQANEEAKKAKQDADNSIQDSHRVKEEAEKSIKAAEEARALAEEEAYNYFRTEIDRVTGEVEIVKNEALEVIARYREESQLARTEAEAIKEASEKAINQAQEEIRKAREEIETLKEELRKTREDAEVKVLRSNEAIEKAIQDFFGQTREEITRTRKITEIAGYHPEAVLERIEEQYMSSSKPHNFDFHSIINVLDEMRAPLLSISGFTRLMLEENIPNTMAKQELLPKMLQQSNTLNRLLDEATSKLTIESSQFEITSKTKVSPNELINDVIHNMRNAALAKNILLGSTIPDTLPEVEADESRIKEALTSLVDNALKFNEGNSTVIIKAQVLETELLILVEDHGIGIPDAEQQSIFEKYYRASNHGDKEGQGLGLNICKQIVESYGGRVHVESIEGEGSTFGFTLPLMYS